MHEWDDTKNASNIAKHGVSFQLARRIFDGPVLTVRDDREDYGEVREISIGMADEIAFDGCSHSKTREATDHFRPPRLGTRKETL